jgi:hypothetical protein
LDPPFTMPFYNKLQLDGTTPCEAILACNGVPACSCTCSNDTLPNPSNPPAGCASSLAPSEHIHTLSGNSATMKYTVLPMRRPETANTLPSRTKSPWLIRTPTQCQHPSTPTCLGCPYSRDLNTPHSTLINGFVCTELDKLVFVSNLPQNAALNTPFAGTSFHAMKVADPIPLPTLHDALPTSLGPLAQVRLTYHRHGRDTIAYFKI